MMGIGASEAYEDELPSPPPAPSVEPAEKPKTCLERILTAWGWTFDILTVGINITDVVSDILVAVQFWNAGEKTWFWLVLSSLILSNIIYTIFGVEIMLRENLNKRWFRPLAYMLVFPFAQLAPTLNWILEQVHPSSIELTAKKADWSLGTGGNEAAAVAEESQAIATQSKVMERLEHALQEHFRTHLLFYIETVVESIPQSIIQLLAITFLGQATGLQVFSMSLSLISIVSKAYVVSHSFTIKTMVFKFMLVAHDLFSLFYVFSTILSKDEADDVKFGAMHFNIMSYIWLIRLFVEVGYATVALIITGIGILVEEVLIHGKTCSCKMVRESIMIVLLALLVSVPVVLAAEGAKLIWLVLAISNIEPKQMIFPAYSFAYSFVSRGNNAERFRFLVKTAVEEKIDASCTAAPKRRRRLRSAKKAKESDGAVPHVVDSPSHEPAADTASLDMRSPEEIKRDERDFRASQMGHHVLRTWTVLNENPFNPRDLYWKVYHVSPSIPEGGVVKDIKCEAECVAAFGAGFGILLYTLGQLYSLVFPFVNYGLNYERQNLLQHFCFIALCVAVFVCLVLSPATYDYVWFCMQMQYFKRYHPRDRELVSRMRHWVGNYHVPPHTFVLQQTIPSSILPPDVTGVVADFLYPYQIDLKGLSIAECAAIRKRMVEPMEGFASLEVDELVRGNTAEIIGDEEMVDENGMPSRQATTFSRQGTDPFFTREASEVIAV